MHRTTIYLPDDLRAVFELNVIAPLAAIQAVVPVMRRQGGGSIVNVSSGTTLFTPSGTGGYAAGPIGQANDAQEVERVAVEHELEATTAPRAVRAQAAQPACELAIVKEVLPRDATAHRRRALAEMQVADDDETVG